VERLDHVEIRNPVLLAPSQEPARRPVIGFARVGIPDRRRKELKETLSGALACTGNGGRHPIM
jgi:hypothetical protein